MPRNEQLRSQIENLEQTALLATLRSGGLGPTPGFQGLALMENGDLYRFQLAYTNRSFSEDGNRLESFDEEGTVELLKTVSAETVDRVKKFLDDEKVVETEYEKLTVFDASYHVYANYKGVHKDIINHIGRAGKEKIFDRADRLLSEISE